MYGLAKIAADENLGKNLAQRNESYYDHVPESTAYGSAVGAAGGLASGALSGYGIGATAKRVDSLAKSNPNFRATANTALKASGFDADIRDVTSKLPKSRKTSLIGAGLGALGGAVAGGYKGLLTGTGMNDRQYLLERNIEPHEMVSNSAMSAMNMSGPSLNPVSPSINQAFGAQIGALRRANYENTLDGSLKRKERE